MFDANDDNRIDLKEFKQPFKDMDKNSDFKIDRNEVVKWLQTYN
jgi:Ca2+-binding EF-hand superfamily protein